MKIETLTQAFAKWQAVRSGTKPRVMPSAAVTEALCAALNGAAMPEATFTLAGVYGAERRREWCRENGAAVIAVADVATRVGKRADVTFRQALIRWQESIPALLPVSYQPVGMTDSDGNAAASVYVFRVGK